MSAFTVLHITVMRWLDAHRADIAWASGLMALAFGIGMIFLPAGVIAGGIAACFTGFALGQDGGPE